MQRLAQRRFVAGVRGGRDQVAIGRQFVAQHPAQHAHRVHVAPDRERGRIVQRRRGVRSERGAQAVQVRRFLQGRVEALRAQFGGALRIEFGADGDGATGPGAVDAAEPAQQIAAVLAVEALVDQQGVEAPRHGQRAGRAGVGGERHGVAQGAQLRAHHFAHDRVVVHEQYGHRHRSASGRAGGQGSR